MSFSYTFGINDIQYIALQNNIYFDKNDKEFAVFLYDIDDIYLKNIIENKENLKIKLSLTLGKVFCHFIVDTGTYKFAFELMECAEIDDIIEMIEDKSLEIGIAFKKDDVLLEDLCFVIDY